MRTEPRDSQEDREQPTPRRAGDWVRDPVIHLPGEPAAPEGRLSAQEVGAVALRRIEELTTGQLVGVTAVRPEDDGWMDVEVLEERRIPSSSDILALYEVELGEAGELIAYRRTRWYTRGSALDGSEAR